MDKEKRAALLKKAKDILYGNIYTKSGYLWDGYRMISPSMGDFLGVWNWDSAFHAIGMIPYDMDMAKEQIEGFLEFQKDDGFLPDVIFERGVIADTYSKPPVMIYSAYRVYEAAKDDEFLKRVYPKLLKNIGFWERERCINGLFHYDADKEGCTDEEFAKRVRFESGWDNSPRWDNGDTHELWAIDLNCYMIMAYRAMGCMSAALGGDDNEWKAKADRLAGLIEENLWNDELNSYTDRNFVTGAFSDVLTPASFMPLYVGTAPRERAEIMEDTAKKHFLPGMPTVAYTDPRFDERAYWRGPCWLNTAYFAAKGLKNYGFDATADTIRDTVLGWVCEDGDRVHENYNAVTGEGMCSDHFSWSCVFVREFLENF